jgi:hypothetical protein
MVDFNAAVNGRGQVMDNPPLKLSDILNMEFVRQNFTEYSEKIEVMKAQAEAHVVENDESNVKAVTMAGEAKRLSKKIEEKRKQIIDEPNTFVKSVNGFCKTFMEPLQSIEKVLKQKVGQYQYKQELARKEAEKKAEAERLKLQAKLDKEAKKKGVEPVQVAPLVLPEEKTVTRTETGSAAHIRKQWKAEVTNEKEVPREFCSPDMKIINQAVKMGVRDIPGVRIFEDVSTVLRT